MADAPLAADARQVPIAPWAATVPATTPVRSTTALGLGTVGALGLVLAVSLAGVLTSADVIVSWGRVALGAASGRELVDAVARFSTLSNLLLLVEVLTAALWILWLRRMFQNAPSLVSRTFRYRPRDAWLWWVIPIANVVMPYRVMAAYARALAPADRGTLRLIRIWWGLWLASGAVSGAVLAMSLRGQPHDALGAFVVMYAALAVDAILAIAIVRRLERLASWRRRSWPGLVDVAPEQLAPAAPPLGGVRLAGVLALVAASLVASVVLTVAAKSPATLGSGWTAADASSWRTFTSPTGAFAVDLPGIPSAGASDVPVEGGSILETTHSASGHALELTVGYFDHPVTTGLARADVEAILDAIVHQFGAPDQAAGPFDCGDMVGADGWFVTSKRSAIRVIAARDRFYYLWAEASGSPGSLADARRFISSFRVDLATLSRARPDSDPTWSTSSVPCVLPDPLVPVVTGGGASPSSAPGPTPFPSGRPTLRPTSSPVATSAPGPWPAGWSAWAPPVWDVTLAYPPGWTSETDPSFGAHLVAPNGVIVLIASRPTSGFRLEEAAGFVRDGIESVPGKVTAFTEDRMGTRRAYWIHATFGSGQYTIDVLAHDGRHEVQLTWVGFHEPSPDELDTFRSILGTITFAS